MSIEATLRLFESVVTSAFLYACGSRTLTQELEDKLDVTRKRMLQMMFGGGRRVRDCGEVESYVDWLKRDTVNLLRTAQKIGVDCWGSLVQA